MVYTFRTALLFFIFINGLTYGIGQGNIKISGIVDHPNSDSINIQFSNQLTVKTFYLDEYNKFSGQLNLPEGYYHLSDGIEGTTIYLIPNSTISLTVDSKQFDETLHYEGEAAFENNYLAKKFLVKEGFGKYLYYNFYAKLKEEEFLKSADSLYQIQVELLNTYPNLSTGFRDLETARLKIELLQKYSSFESMKRFVTGNRDYKVSENYPDPYQNLDLNDEKLYQVFPYLMLLRTYLQSSTRNKLPKNYKGDYHMAYLNTIDQTIESQKIKNELVYIFGNIEFDYTKQPDSAYRLIQQIQTNELYSKEIAKSYALRQKFSKGSLSPDFLLRNFDEELVSLNDFGGKLVYIDIWATWCSPCLKEIPDLQELIAYFEGQEIAFVSICALDTKEKWKKMVNDKSLNGIQLFEPNKNSDFLNAYNVQGVPRFILINKKGKIIDPNAKRPSDPTLKEDIKRYLEE